MSNLPLLAITIMAICIILQSERGIFDFFSYLRLFRQLKHRESGPQYDRSEKKMVFILIPMLREQTIAEDAILGFCKLTHERFNIKIVVLTSEKELTEQKELSQSTTEDVLFCSMQKGKLSAYKDMIIITRDPNARGNMATQLNYGLKIISETVSGKFFYMVYNADSVLSKQTFDGLANLIDKYPSKEFAVQQPCAFVREMNPSSNNFTNAMSLYQSWYCLGHESRIVRNYAKRSEKWWGKKNGKLGVVVGHGSGMTINIHRSNSGYPSELLTEDLTFGFILSTKNIPILSLPALEIADVPTHFSMFIKQKSIWFWNFLGYGNCYRKMLHQGYSLSKTTSLLIQGISAGAYWFLDTFFILTPLIISLYYKSSYGVAISIMSFLIFYILPQYVLFKRLPSILDNQDFSFYAKNINKVSFAKILPTLCLIILTNSVGPWIATIKWLGYIVTGRLPAKYKTGD